MKSNKTGVFAAVRTAVRTHPFLTFGTLLCVAASICALLVPPLLLAGVIDDLTGGIPLSFGLRQYSFISEALRLKAYSPPRRKLCL